ncbi:hypothetical protein EUTSA_v10007615mg [Eutrema salsugineum]|uniref:Anaphase-promoting complex subunit 4 WD40 domain-containing protein n=1 Tax=Eutrema salsugineum TaxID=72664 RepID=V4KVM8_EUTSA|nr:hypothetical protein EUTSA_v10007615mg [Eutrema salsugineum]
MWEAIQGRETGRIRSNSFVNQFKSRRILSLQLSNRKDFVSPHRGSVNSLQVDLTEGRYLLSGASDGSAAVFDIQRATDYEASGLIAKHRCIFTVDKQHENGHKYAISSAIWYPIDTGLFVTGSYDHYIKVWDTNTAQAVVDFKMPGKVYRTAMSSLAMSHTLIAAGTEDVQVRLCDIASGAFAHTLSGHRDGVMSVEWSTSSEWVLYTGGCDGAIRFWDIRRAGCFRVLDQSVTQLGVRPPISKHTAVSSKVSAEKSSSGGKNRLKVLQRKHTGSQITKGPSSAKASVEKSRQKRLHPGMLSTLDRATAHYGAVTGLKATNDGMYLLSAGSDSRIRLWDTESGCNTLLNFETGRIQTTKAIQLATSDDPALVFVPCMKTVKAFGMWSGRTTLMFRGHYENVNTCCFNSSDQVQVEEVAEDKDNWSD